MSTRATYQFVADPQRLRPAYTFYIHHDGYPEGAAYYFQQALLYSHGLLPERFLRANERAELTRDHEAHGDTDYRYTLDGMFLTAEQRRQDIDGWRGWFAGDLLDFIHANGGQRLLAWRGQHYNQESATRYLVELLDQLAHQTASGWTGNASSTANDVWALSLKLAEQWGFNAATEYAAMKVAEADRVHCKAYGWAGSMNISEDEAYAQWVERFRTAKPN